MDPVAPAAAPSGLIRVQAPSLAQINGQEAAGNSRETYLWRPWLSSVNDPPRQARTLTDWASSRPCNMFAQPAGGATAAEAIKVESDFHHPVRLFWPKSRSFDYLYSAGEMLLHVFPVQATINLYDDSDSEEDEENMEADEEEEVNEIWPGAYARVPEATAHRVTARFSDPYLTYPN
ncbi:ripply1 [Sigmodon hispidus]